MREMNLLDIANQKNNRERMKFITTQTSSKLRPADEIIILAQSARYRFKKAVASGKIEIQASVNGPYIKNIVDVLMEC